MSQAECSDCRLKQYYHSHGISVILVTGQNKLSGFWFNFYCTNEFLIEKQKMARKTTTPEPPIHILSTIVTLVLDYIWMVPEASILALRSSRIIIPGIIILVLILGVVCFLAVFAVQIFVARDTFGPAFAKALVMSIVAAVPYPVVTTILGVPLLGWAGIYYSEAQLRKWFIRS